jgi:hypothetical protein
VEEEKMEEWMETRLKMGKICDYDKTLEDKINMLGNSVFSRTCSYEDATELFALEKIVEYRHDIISELVWRTDSVNNEAYRNQKYNPLPEKKNKENETWSEKHDRILEDFSTGWYSGRGIPFKTRLELEKTKKTLRSYQMRIRYIYDRIKELAPYGYGELPRRSKLKDKD